jgi:hypothetical protein
VSEFLTQEQVNELPAGSEVELTWSGGNGPWRYRIVIDPDGTRCVDTIYRDPIDFVGDRPPFTTVRLVAASEERTA